MYHPIKYLGVKKISLLVSFFFYLWEFIRIQGCRNHTPAGT